MTKSTTWERLALAGIAGTMMAGVMAASPLWAAEGPAKEKCAGVAKAGKNDCATKANSCAGHTTTDRQAEAWIYLPAGTCAKIAGGSVVPSSK